MRLSVFLSLLLLCFLLLQCFEFKKVDDIDQCCLILHQAIIVVDVVILSNTVNTQDVILVKHCGGGGG